MRSRRTQCSYPFTSWRRTFVLIPALVVAALAAAQSASAATLSPTPTVSTGSAVNIGSDAATVWGTVNSNGEAATYRFDYGTSPNYTSHTISEPIGDATPQSVDARLTGLSPNTVYHYRIEATDAWGTSYGTDQFFTTTGGTQSLPPAVATGSASGVGTGSASVSGTVNPNGLTTTYHFDYGTSTNYTSQAPATPDPSAGSGTTAQTESTTLTGLSPNTLYHYRIEATTASGTSYGADQTFTTTGGTQAQANEVLTGTATTVSGGSNGGLCLGNGPSSGYVSFNAAGSATGASPDVPAPYPGTFTETNASASLYRSAGQTQVKLSIPFTISSGTATINGTITNPSPYAGGGQFLCGNFYIFGIGVTTNTANYTATIQGPDRPTQTVSGTAQVSVSLQFRPYGRLYTSPITETLLNFPSP